jgi:NADH-quinone oxidoreductase subunit J
MNYILTLISSLLLACGTLVIGVQNPIHSILFLILVFFNGSLLLFFFQVEFFGIIFLIVYVGAVIVLFLFMVMMLKIKYINTSQNLLDFFPYGGLIALLLFIELLLVTKNMSLPFSDLYWEILPLNLEDIVNKIFTFQINIENVGKALYTSYIFPFLEAGFILFIAMVGAMVVTLDSENSKNILVKKQDPINQAVKIYKNVIFFSLQTMSKNTPQLEKNIYIKLWTYIIKIKN